MRRHDLDGFSLASGLLFLLVGAGYLVDAFTEVRVDARWSSR